MSLALSDDARAKARRFFEVARKACEAKGLPLKHDGSFGVRLCFTFHGEGTARAALDLLAPALDKPLVAVGFDPGEATDIANGRRRDVKVWRLHGWIKGNAP